MRAEGSRNGPLEGRGRFVKLTLTVRQHGPAARGAASSAPSCVQQVPDAALWGRGGNTTKSTAHNAKPAAGIAAGSDGAGSDGAGSDGASSADAAGWWSWEPPAAAGLPSDVSVAGAGPRPRPSSPPTAHASARAGPPLEQYTEAGEAGKAGEVEAAGAGEGAAVLREYFARLGLRDVMRR